VATFTMAAPGAGLPPARKPKARAVPLGEFERGWTSLGVYEVIRAATADGLWLFERSADGTWETGHLPTKTVVKVALQDLPACRAHVRSGKALADLERIQAERKENGDD
jgi:hypothetical protein